MQVYFHIRMCRRSRSLLLFYPKVRLLLGIESNNCMRKTGHVIKLNHHSRRQLSCLLCCKHGTFKSCLVYASEHKTSSVLHIVPKKCTYTRVPAVSIILLWKDFHWSTSCFLSLHHYYFSSLRLHRETKRKRSWRLELMMLIAKEEKDGEVCLDGKKERCVHIRVFIPIASLSLFLVVSSYWFLHRIFLWWKQKERDVCVCV